MAASAQRHSGGWGGGGGGVPRPIVAKNARLQVKPLLCQVARKSHRTSAFCQILGHQGGFTVAKAAECSKEVLKQEGPTPMW
jgi:hypothetical protein